MSSTISASKVKELRDISGAGMMDCKKALTESDGDIQKAMDFLRKSGIAKAQKKAGREVKDGVISTYIHPGSKLGVMLEINCETDFVAKNDDFLNFVKELGEINNNCSSDMEKLNKSQMSNGKNVEENLVALIAKIGEKITIGKTKTVQNLNSYNYVYQHSVIKDNVSKLGVIVSLETDGKSEKISEFGKQLSMHIAASNPLALNAEGIQNDILEKEKKLISEELKNSGKSAEIASKISIGKINKFKEENSLLTQNWVMEPKKKVQDVISEINISSLKINEFIRMKIGE